MLGVMLESLHIFPGIVVGVLRSSRDKVISQIIAESLDIEKSAELVYNEGVAFHGGFCFNCMIYLVLLQIQKE